jgi:hypothetical protein
MTVKQYINQFKIGFSLCGFLAFALQELPYLPWLLCPPVDNPLANSPPANIFLGILEQGGGILTIALLILIVRKTVAKIELKSIVLLIATLCILIYYICWVCYFLGITNGWLIVIGLSAVVPIYYFFIALWIKNDFAIITSILFLIGHTGSNLLNYLR